MRNYSESLGLDISKSHFDAVLHQKKLHRQFENNSIGFKKMDKMHKLNWLHILAQNGRSFLLIPDRESLRKTDSWDL